MKRSACLLVPLLPLVAAAQTRASYVPWADAAPIVRALRADRLPPDLRMDAAAVEAAWPAWVARRDAAIRARVDEGDADAIVYLLQFGTSFTRQPRIGERELAGVVVRQAGGGASRFVPSPALVARIDDFISALASPGTNARMQFARRVIERAGLDPVNGKDRVRQYLQDRVEVIGQAERAARLLNPEGDPVDRMTLFRDRGLASDTTILVSFGVEQTLAALKAAGVVQPGSVRRVAIVGPGLDFTDKQEGYDFYPEQTIQPFAAIDSLRRLGLAAADLQIAALDVSPRVLQHLEDARARARAGVPYTVAVPRGLDQPWTRELVRYWERFGDRIAQPAKIAAPPPTAGRVDVRGAAFPPSAVLSVVPGNLNVILQRIDPIPAADRFDLVVATNVLIYYDVFEQSLALANVARMLRPGGVFLSNDRIVELPGSALASIGHTSAIYLQAAGAGGRGDRIDWYSHSPR